MTDDLLPEELDDTALQAWLLETVLEVGRETLLFVDERIRESTNESRRERCYVSAAVLAYVAGQALGILESFREPRAVEVAQAYVDLGMTDGRQAVVASRERETTGN